MVTAMEDDILLRYNDYKGSKEHFEWKLSEQDDFLKATAGSVKQLERKYRLVATKKRLSEKACEELLKACGIKNSVMGKSVRRPVKRVSAHFVVVTMCISRAFPRSFLR